MPIPCFTITQARMASARLLTAEQSGEVAVLHNRQRRQRTTVSGATNIQFDNFVELYRGGIVAHDGLRAQCLHEDGRLPYNNSGDLLPQMPSPAAQVASAVASADCTASGHSGRSWTTKSTRSPLRRPAKQWQPNVVQDLYLQRGGSRVQRLLARTVSCRFK